jgi:hypothetical protein
MQNCVVNLRSVSLPAPSTLRATSLNGPSNCAASRQVPWAVAGLAAAVLSSSTVLLEVPAHAAPQLTFASPDVKAKLEERDNNMAFKCTGNAVGVQGILNAGSTCLPHPAMFPF